MLGYICAGYRMVPSNLRCPERAEERVLPSLARWSGQNSHSCLLGIGWQAFLET